MFGTAYREAHYILAIRACCLEPDIAAWPHGDLTHIGDRGTTLSGGQRARLALARAVYQVGCPSLIEPHWILRLASLAGDGPWSWNLGSCNV